jgi:hypothetical protein
MLPDLARLSPLDRSALVEKLLFTDNESSPAYYRRLTALHFSPRK